MYYDHSLLIIMLILHKTSNNVIQAATTKMEEETSTNHHPPPLRYPQRNTPLKRILLQSLQLLRRVHRCLPYRNHLQLKIQLPPESSSCTLLPVSQLQRDYNSPHLPDLYVQHRNIPHVDHLRHAHDELERYLPKYPGGGVDLCR